MAQIVLYDAFTKIPSTEKRRLVEFLLRNQEEDQALPASAVEEALDLAVKERPSFGGFVLQAKMGKSTHGALVVHRTGMESPSSRYRLVCLALSKTTLRNGIAAKLIAKALSLTDGDLSLVLDPGHPALRTFEKMGFATRPVLQLRLFQPALQHA